MYNKQNSIYGDIEKTLDDATSPIILVDISGTVLDSAKFTSALRGLGLVVKDSYKKPIVPVSVQHCIVRVGVVFVTVELVNFAKMINLRVEQRLTNRQGDLSMQLVVTKQVHQKITGADLLRGNNREREHGRTKDSHCGNIGYGGADGVIADRGNRTN